WDSPKRRACWRTVPRSPVCRRPSRSRARCADPRRLDTGRVGGGSRPPMAFKQYLREEITRGLDETYTEEVWAKDFPGKAYYDVHLSPIEQHEMATPTFREYLARGGFKILESGCGTGRWMSFFETMGNRAFGVDDSWGPLRVAREHDPDM